MTDEDHKALIHKRSSEIRRPNHGVGSIISRAVSDALVVAR